MESQVFFLDYYSELLNDNGILICEDVKYEYLQEFRRLLHDKDDTYIFDLRWNRVRGGNDDAIIIRYK